MRRWGAGVVAAVLAMVTAGCGRDGDKAVEADIYAEAERAVRDVEVAAVDPTAFGGLSVDHLRSYLVAHGWQVLGSWHTTRPETGELDDEWDGWVDAARRKD